MSNSTFDPDVRNYVITYESWEAYNAKSEDEAIAMFKCDGHSEDEIVDIDY